MSLYVADKHSFFSKLILGIEGEAQKSELAANVACDRVNTISKSLRASELRHKKVFNNLKAAESKAAELCQQQSRTRKKLHSLYSSLQSALSRSDDNSTSRIPGSRTDETFNSFEVGITIVNWWKISVLQSFKLGSPRDFVRHIALRRNSELVLRNCDESNLTDVVMPICQHFLLGTCLDEKCPYRHPPLHLKSITDQEHKKSRGNHFSWVLEKYRQYLSSETAAAEQDEQSSSSKSKHDDLSGRPFTDSANCNVIEEFSKKKDATGRYFDVSDNLQISSSSYTGSCAPWGWVEQFTEQATAAVARCHVSTAALEAFPDAVSSNTVDLSSPFLTTHREKLGYFCFSLLYGLCHKGDSQRNLCIRCCLQPLKDVIDRLPPSPSDASALEGAWQLFLLLSLECGIIHSNPQLELWPLLLRYLHASFPQSAYSMLLLAAVRLTIAPRAMPASRHYSDQAASKRETPITPGLALSSEELRTSAVPSTSVHFVSDIYSALGVLNDFRRLCEGSRAEEVVGALCTHLHLPLPFGPQPQSCCSIRNVDIAMGCLSREIAYPMLFVTFFTGKCVGTKLLCSHSSVLCMEIDYGECVGQLQDLFRRCPSLLLWTQDAFLSCFSALEKFRHLDSSHVIKAPWPSSLSLCDQCVCWSYSLFLSSGGFRTLKGPGLQDLRLFCDPFHYPGVYEGARAGPSSPAYKEGTDDSSAAESNSAQVRDELLSALNSYLDSTKESSGRLKAALEPVLELSNSEGWRGAGAGSCPSHTPSAINPLLPYDVQQMVKQLWTDLGSALIPISVAATTARWVLGVGESIPHCTASDVESFQAAFVDTCRLYSPGLLGSEGGGAVNFMAVITHQVLAVVRAACSSNSSHAMCVCILRMVCRVIEASQNVESAMFATRGTNDTLKIDGAANTSEGGSEEEGEAVRKRQRTGTRALPVVFADTRGRKGGGREDGALACSMRDLDSTGPTAQHRLLERTVQLLDGSGMVTYNSIQFLLHHCLPTMRCPDLLVRLVLQWFLQPESDNDDGDDVRREGSRTDLLPPKTTLKNSILIANIFQNNRFLSSQSLLSRLSPSSLFQICFHFLRAEFFESFSKAQSLLPKDSLHCILLSSYTEGDALSRLLLDNRSDAATGVECADGDAGGCSLVEDLHLCSDSMLQRFQESLNECLVNKKRSADLSCFVPQELGYFPFQSLALLSDHLTDLNLSNNFLTVFPTSVLFLSKLRKLNLSCNKMQTLPANLHTSFSELRTLDLSCNQFLSFPSSVLQLGHLEELRLGGNEIQYLPVLKGLTNLQHLDVSGNPLKVLGSELSHIRYLKT